jgi:hypothetical protein
MEVEEYDDPDEETALLHPRKLNKPVEEFMAMYVRGALTMFLC